MKNDISTLIANPTNIEMHDAGFTQTHGLGLWTNPHHPLVLIDTNADIVSVYVYDRASDVGSIVDAADFFTTRDIFYINGIPVREAI